VNSFEIGAKNNIDNRIKLASSNLLHPAGTTFSSTVVPPVCQISFISNLGQATAKGIDIQAEVALTDTFTLEVATGLHRGRATHQGFETLCC